MIDPQDIRDQARSLLESGEVRLVLGYRDSTAGPMAAPAFVSRPEDADDLTWDPTCVHNLALYLVDECKKQAAAGEGGDRRPVALVAKGCDSRGIVVLLQEKYFSRDDVRILGVSCERTGVIDQRKLAQRLDGRTADATAFTGADIFRITTDDGDIEIPAREILADRCLECRAPSPAVNDILFGEAVERTYDESFHALEAAERAFGGAPWTFWRHQFDRCLRCYACRSVCPMCYCEECVVDSIVFNVSPDTSAEEKANRIKWIERSAVTSENAGYHLVRALHLAGRCIDCGECERVCPVNIPLRLLNSKLEKEAYEAFGYRPGTDADLPSLVASFRDDDPNDFIR